MSKTILIAGTNSGCGKTTVTLGLMAAFSKRGLKVQGFKVGPDYIDPGLHTVVTGRVSINLDTWMMPDEFLKYSFISRAEKADISIIEGVMGLYDGRLPDADDGSTAELAKALGVPVILVVNAKSMARTVSAIINGMLEFDTKVNIIGVILNNVGSQRHLEILEKSIKKYCKIPVFGGMPKNEDVFLPSRHLGLFTGEEGVLTKGKIEALASLILSHVDIEKIEHMADFSFKKANFSLPDIGCSNGVVAIARDRAFCFYYEDNLDVLKSLGYQLVEFSPINDDSLPENTEMLYLGGGYPELYTEELYQNVSMIESVQKFSESGKTVYAECGGLMYLGRSITTLEGKSFSMCGCMPYSTNMLPRRTSLGYVEISSKDDFWFLKRSQKVRGHAFHYSRITLHNDFSSNFYTGVPENKAVGYRKQNILVSYVHLHFAALYSTQKRFSCS